MKTIFSITVFFVTCLLVTAAEADSTVGFDGGDDGGFTGNAFFEATGDFFFNNANFDVRMDNVSVMTTPIPEPTGGCVLFLTGLMGLSRRRSKNG